MSKADLRKFTENIETNVLSILTENTNKKFRPALDKVNVFLDLSSDNLIKSNPRTFGSPNLSDYDRSLLLSLYKTTLLSYIKPDRTIKFKRLLSNADRYSKILKDSTLTPKITGRNTIYIWLTDDNNEGIGAIAIAPTGQEPNIFASLKRMMLSTSNHIDDLLKAANKVKEPLEGFDNRMPTRLRFTETFDSKKKGKKDRRNAVNLGHLGLAEESGRTPLTDKLEEARNHLRSFADNKKASLKQKSVALRLERFINTNLEKIHKAHAPYVINTEFSRSVNNLVVGGHVSAYIVAPQQTEINQGIIGKQEARINRRLGKYAKSYFKNNATLVNMGGSPSIFAMARMSVLSLISGARDKARSFTTKDSKKVKQDNKRNKKKKLLRVSTRGIPLPSVSKRSTGISTQSVLSLQVLINQYLPDTIRKNMIYPRLVYRSGRFAKSARVVRSIDTIDGFKIFRYTYMKNPYSTFEPGGAQGTKDRDPRDLIEKSIREIATKLVGAKFKSEPI